VLVHLQASPLTLPRKMQGLRPVLACM